MIRTAARKPRLVASAIVIIWVFLCSPFPRSLGGAGIAVAALLVALDAWLLSVSGWVAFTPGTRLDERQRQLRDRAFRAAFRMVGTGVVAIIVGTILGSLEPQGDLVSRIPNGMPPRQLLALLELFLMAPTVALAFLLPRETAPGPDPSMPQRPAVRVAHVLFPLMAGGAVVAVWMIALTATPTQVTNVRVVPDHEVSGSIQDHGGTCGHLATAHQVAGGLLASVSLRAEVCWDGHQAWVYDDLTPRLGEPKRAMDSQVPWLTSCVTERGAADFASVDPPDCTQEIDQAGTLHLSLHSRVSAGWGNLASRPITIDLRVARNGDVLD